MRDHTFDVEPEPPVPAGRAVFRAHNRGDVAHELVVVDVPDSPASEGGSQVVLTLGVVNARPPGQGGSVAVDLAPGRYALVCLLRNDDGVAHSDLGMVARFEVH